MIYNSPFLFICKYIFFGYTCVQNNVPLHNYCNFLTHPAPSAHLDYIPTDRQLCTCSYMFLDANSYWSWKRPPRSIAIIWSGDHQLATSSNFLWLWHHLGCLCFQLTTQNRSLLLHKDHSVCYHILNNDQAFFMRNNYDYMLYFMFTFLRIIFQGCK